MNEPRQPSLAEVSKALEEIETIYLALHNLKAVLTVPGGPTDVAPIIADPVPVVMTAGQVLRVVITATDADAPPIMELLGALPWVEALAGPGLLTITLSPPVDVKGPYALDVKATDATGLVDIATLMVNVAAPDAVPMGPVPTGIMVTSKPGGLDLMWDQAPADVTRTFVSWGTAGLWVGDVKLPQGTAVASIRGLAAQEYSVDVGFIRGTLWPTAAAMVRVKGTPLPAVIPMPVPGTRPDALNTGIRVGAEGLKLVEGRFNITQPGLYAGYRVIGQVFVDAPDVELADCWITAIYPGDGAVRNRNYSSLRHPRLVVHHCRIDGRNMREPAGYGVLGAQHLHHCDISGCADSVKLGCPGEIIEDNYLHHHAMGYSSVHGGPTHNDGMQAQAGLNGIIRRNSVIGPVTDGGQGTGDPKTCANGGIFLKSDSGPCVGYQVYDNYVIGWGFCGHFYNDVRGTEFRDNVLGIGPGFASYGPLSLSGAATTGVKCYGNTTQAGAAVGNRN